ncbi:MAG: flagellar basal body P-ring formation protein FlgA [Synergistaceae bacterium]|nr:flagellar basal body P-ring formation protein FlgA [Synergistaceae bacterium]MBQ3398639.1 flagellar basal body P-ring formation protein FlgA [Synergistaceae bacterium]MBQ3760007.1 flagellar basal body P-ring formation protein FlgA [Synergistaceae bacterium]MBQ4402331.1 flagellar basal body P-ring formation protein FlgA [Synergistaceae bacterium]MBQ6114098.1 flagellar basal body P-ring formation protein FlgA [Synergistaceae bacterium]
MMRNCRQRLMWLLLFAILLAVPAYSEQSVVLEIPAVIYTNKGTLRLGEIARITGGSRKVRDAIANIQVWNDGQTLDRREVMRAIEDSDVSDVRLEIRMPLSSRIETPDYEGNFTDTSPSPSRSLNDLVPMLKEMSGWKGGIEISANSPIPEGRLIDPASIIPGTSGATLRFQDSAGRVRPLNVRLTWSQNALFATRNIKKGDRITPQSVYTRPMKITRPGIYPSEVSEVSGFTSNRNIKQGEPLEYRHLTSSQLIKRGRQVKIVARYNGASATTDGVLMEDGRPGEWVKVRKADDKRVTLRARIIDENTVEVSAE